MRKGKQNFKRDYVPKWNLGTSEEWNAGTSENLGTSCPSNFKREIVLYYHYTIFFGVRKSYLRFKFRDTVYFQFRVRTIDYVNKKAKAQV